MKPVLKNPVLCNPWISKMPNNYRGSKGAANPTTAKYLIHKAQQECLRPRRIPKAIVTRIYADQLKPLYPYLTMTHVKAALTLADNNMHESRLLLDMKYKMFQMRRVVHSPKLENSAELRNLKKENVGENTSSEDKKLLDSDDSFSTVTASTSESSLNSSLSNLQESDNATNNKVCTVAQFHVPSGSTSGSASTSCIRRLSSSVYDFSEPESEPEPVENWFDYRQGVIKRAPPNRKIGVVITRCKNSYKVCLL